MTTGLPNSLLEVLQFALLCIFATTTIASIVTLFITRRNGLLNLGLQTALLCLSAHLSQGWLFPYLFRSVFTSAAQFDGVMLTVMLLSGALAVDVALGQYVWSADQKKDRVNAPRLLIGVVQTLIYAVTILVILQFVYGQSITALVTLSGAAAVVLGLSAQTTLGEMFAGIAIAISRPFRIGDWIKVGDLEEGQVIDQTWRLVRIRTRERTILNVTNRLIADRPIKNFSYPSNIVRVAEIVQFPCDVDPGQVKALLRQAVAACPAPLTDPGSNVVFRGTRDGLSEFVIVFHIDDYATKPLKADAVWECIIDAVHRSDLSIGMPRRRIEVASDPEHGTVSATPLFPALLPAIARS